ncbi:glycerophosphodiester phosphodiesterase [Aliidiomarina taiwanensis]|uniref:Glycerophosphodiester phosphodiesterase n=1 Tax=Aliidiomarina taiwanensis TaxID=946228 RepID=A0A432WYQ1_9GAMM|nr:glycerophosphodiester phosphodiesterase [Aliidiomarina taiwanensis]RUO38902.1 glycerophosphodiester phosphodiesterase [Aliidiomarina taiwanensis]
MLIIAHRGASAVTAENTLAAFEEAIHAQADAIELDVYQVENQLYVFHDRHLTRLTSSTGRFVDLTDQQVQSLLVLGQHAIPTLEQALAHIAGRTALNIELKGPIACAQICRHLEKAVHQFGFTEQSLLVSSFNHHWLKELKQARPQTRIGALTASCPLSYAAFASELNAYSVHIDVNTVTEAFVADAHARGLAVYVYTVDDPADMVWLHKIGVDGIFTNHPQLTRQSLQLILN